MKIRMRAYIVASSSFLVGYLLDTPTSQKMRKELRVKKRQVKKMGGNIVASGPFPTGYLLNVPTGQKLCEKKFRMKGKQCLAWMIIHR